MIHQVVPLPKTVLGFPRRRGMDEATRGPRPPGHRPVAAHGDLRGPAQLRSNGRKRRGVEYGLRWFVDGLILAMKNDGLAMKNDDVTYENQ